MASLIYDSFMLDLAEGTIDLDLGDLKVALVTSSYTPNKGTHDRFNDVTNQVTGTGYTAGGAATDATLTLDTTNHRLDITFDNVTWANSTLTARAAVIYQDTGTSSTSPLIAYVDFGQDVSSTSAAFAVTFSSALRLQN